MSKAVIALGSNLGDRLLFLRRAVDHIKLLGSITAISPLYDTSPYGFSEQPNFLNAVLLLDTSLSAVDLLRALKKIEKDVGRKKRIRWGPREIDLDIIIFNGMKIKRKDLTIPHPNFHRRIFVLKPLAALAADLLVPGFQKTIRELLNKCEDKTIIKLVQKDWYNNGAKV